MPVILSRAASNLLHVRVWLEGGRRDSRSVAVSGGFAATVALFVSFSLLVPLVGLRSGMSRVLDFVVGGGLRVVAFASGGAPLAR